MEKILEFAKKYTRTDLPELKSGMRVRVHEKGMSAFEGIILAVKHGRGMNASFTVRGKSGETGMEKIYPLHSPNLNKVEILSEAKTRRSKLYFVRKISERELRRKLKPVTAK